MAARLRSYGSPMTRFARRCALACLLLTACAGQASVTPAAKPRMTSPAFLEDMTWPEGERAPTPDAIVVLPIGAASKEHGPPLRLANDWLMAAYLPRRPG